MPTHTPSSSPGGRASLGARHLSSAHADPTDQADDALEGGQAPIADAAQAQAAQDPQSDATVDARDPAALARWADALKVTTEALESAIQAVGPRIDRIKDFLAGGMAGRQADG